MSLEERQRVRHRGVVTLALAAGALGLGMGAAFWQVPFQVETVQGGTVCQVARQFPTPWEGQRLAFAGSEGLGLEEACMRLAGFARSSCISVSRGTADDCAKYWPEVRELSSMLVAVPHHPDQRLPASWSDYFSSQPYSSRPGQACPPPVDAQVFALRRGSANVCLAFGSGSDSESTIYTAAHCLQGVPRDPVKGKVPLKIVCDLAAPSAAIDATCEAALDNMEWLEACKLGATAPHCYQDLARCTPDKPLPSACKSHDVETDRTKVAAVTQVEIATICDGGGLVLDQLHMSSWPQPGRDFAKGMPTRSPTLVLQGGDSGGWVRGQVGGKSAIVGVLARPRLQGTDPVEFVPLFAWP